MKNVRIQWACALASLCMAVTSFSAAPAVAQSVPQPAAVISIAKFERTMSDVDYLVDASGFGQMKFMIQTQITHFLKGIDQTRPAGVLMYMDEGAEQPTALGFVPVSDLDDLLDTISGFAEVDEGDEYTTIVTDDDKEIFVKQVDGYAFLSDKPEMFERIPDNSPADLLEDLPQRYGFSAKIFGQRIPKSLRDKAITMIREAYEQQLEELDEEDATQAQLQQESFDINMREIESLVQETEQITIGTLVDQENKTISGEMEFVGIEGSKTAKRASINSQPKPSQFSGFLLPGVLFNAVSRTQIIQEDIDQYDKLMTSAKQTIVAAINEESDLSADKLDVVEQAVTDLFAAMNETLAEGVFDMGMVAEIAKGNMNGAAGFLIADPKKLEQVVKNLVAEMEAELSEQGGVVKLNADSYKGVTFHSITIDTPEESEEVLDALGEQAKIVIGIGDKTAYVAAGSDPLPLLKRAMDGDAASEPAKPTLGVYSMYIAPMMAFGAEMQPDQPMVGALAEKLAENGRDRLRYELQTVPNGFKIRMDLQDGFLELIGAAAQGAGQGAPGQF